MLQDFMLIILIASLVYIALLFVVSLIDHIISGLSTKEDYTSSVIYDCICSFKEFPERIKDNPIMKDIFKLLISANEDENFQTNLAFVYEFNSLTNTDDFRLFMERNYIDGYFSLTSLTKLKSVLDSFFTFREGPLYNTDI